MDGSLLAILAAIIWIDLILSGDNAVVIALVCRGLPVRQQTAGMVFGAGAAIMLRIGMALAASFLLQVNGLRIIGGLLILWIAYGLVRDEAGGDPDVKAPRSMWSAIAAIGFADASMSLDNVMAVAAIARGNKWLIMAGIIFSIPIVIGGAAIIERFVNRFPWLVWLGSALLVWVGLSVIWDDPLIKAAWSGWVSG